jgi:ABC-type transporter Mla subunit MlaD
MGPSLPGSTALMSLAGRATEAVETALSLLPRMTEMLADAEALVKRVDALMTDVESTVERARTVVDRTDAVVERTEAVVDRAAPLLEQFHPTLTQLHPILDRITTTTEADEVSAIVEMLNLTPELMTKLRTDIIPVIDTMGTVAPDVRDILDVSRQLNEMLAAVPGLGRMRRRAEEEEGAEATYRADEEPPSSPDRGD